MAMVRAMGAAGAFNIDTSRFYREALPPHVYLASSYYKKWLLGLEHLLVDKGYVGADEVKAGHALTPAKPLTRGQFTARRCRAHHGARQVRPAGAGAGEIQGRATACARRTSIRRRTRACRAMCAAMSAWSSAITAAMCFRTRPRSGGREPAMALHGGVRLRRIVGRRRRPDGEDLDRRVRAVSGASVMDARCRRARGRPRAFRATPKGRCSASRGRRRPSR